MTSNFGKWPLALLFYDNIGFPVEKMEFGPFSQSWGKREIFQGLRTGEDVTQGPF